MFRAILIIFFLFSMIGCDSLRQKEINKKPSVQDLSLNSLVRQNRQIKSAIVLLESGHIETATEFVDEVLEANPVHKTARLLKRQLEFEPTDIKDWFGTERMTSYTIKKNDALADIAEFWLGNPLYFVTLAKINKIKTPLKIKPGMVIKIPVLESSELVKSEGRRSTKSLKLVEQALNDKKYIQGLEKTNKLFVLERDFKKMLELQRSLLNNYAKSSVSLSDREVMIASVLKTQEKTDNQQRKNIYIKFINQQSRELYLDQAILLFDDKSYVEAASKLALVTELEKEMHQEFKSPEIKRPLLDKLHEQAIVLYSKHDLKQALGYWKLILGVEPENSIAQKYMNRTETLLEKLGEN